jgi:CofD-related protein of GAK system
MSAPHPAIPRRPALPDPVLLARYRNAPGSGPRVLFFSGGSALTGISRILKQYTHNSIHLVTPFDSGGSSAKLRHAFSMPSIGDLRSRLVALADENASGHPEVYRLFSYRFPGTGAAGELLARLECMVRGTDPLVAAIPGPVHRLIRDLLDIFRESMPEDFDLRGASAGNLVLAGGYLKHHRQLDPVVFLFSKLVNVLGTVRTVVNDDLHLAAELQDGRCITGQWRLTGKETEPLQCPVRRLFLSSHPDRPEPAVTSMRDRTRELIRQAELVCYPPGSFYTSLLANLLPAGAGAAIADSECPKVYIPNLGHDPEQIGMTLDGAVQTLLAYLQGTGAGDRPLEKLLNVVLLDSRHGRYTTPLPVRRLEDLGIRVVDTPLVSRESAPYYDAGLLVAALLSLCRS